MSVFAGSHRLKPHRDTPPSGVAAVEVAQLGIANAVLRLRFVVRGAAGLLLPPPTSPGRANGLWQTTCFELFLRGVDDDSYVEFNFSPSGQWAAYAFTGTRTGMRDLALSADPHVEAAGAGTDFVLDVAVDLASVPVARRMSLTAVIEETDGTKSYWALAHPPGKPDFHDPACFVLELPAADGP